MGRQSVGVGSIRVRRSFEGSVTVGSHLTTLVKNRLNLMQSFRKSGRFCIDVCSTDTACEKHLIDVCDVLSELIIRGYLVEKTVVRFTASIIIAGAIDAILSRIVQFDIGADYDTGIIEIVSLNCVNGPNLLKCGARVCP